MFTKCWKDEEVKTDKKTTQSPQELGCFNPEAAATRMILPTKGAKPGACIPACVLEKLRRPKSLRQGLPSSTQRPETPAAVRPPRPSYDHGRKKGDKEKMETSW